MFLFKLHSPQDYIVGGGFFIKFSFLPSSLAWEAFGVSNGASTLTELKNRVYKYKKTTRLVDPDPQIGCIIISAPFYFDEADWIPVPNDWKGSIVQGKTYSTSENQGLLLFEKVQHNLIKKGVSNLTEVNPFGDRYGKDQIIKPRIGQGAFKVLITDAYQRRCAITGEKTLPVLEAAHTNLIAKKVHMR